MRASTPLQQLFSSTRLPVIVLGSLLFLTACGFQLRGQLNLPEGLQTMSLSCSSQATRDLCRQLRDSLTDAEIEVVSQDSDVPAARLTLHEVKDSRRAVSVASDAGVAEYELTRSVTFSFSDNAGNLLIDKDKTTQFQSYSFDENSVLGKDREEAQIREDLNRLLTQDILSRVASQSGNR